MVTRSLVVALLTGVSRLAAGQQQPPTIPGDLAVALLDHGESQSGNRTPRIVVGRAPAGIPGSLTKAEGAVVLGGVEYPQSAIVVLSFTRPPNQAVLAFDNEIATHGWKPPRPPENPYSPQGGFVSSEYFSGFTGGGEAATLFCSDSGVATISYSPAPGGGTYLKVQHSRDIERSMCGRHVDFMITRQRLLKFPTLHAPVGMTQRGGGGGSGGADAETSGRLYGPIDVADIVAHYLTELDSAGWKTGRVATSGTVSVASLETTSPDGQQWIGAFIASRVTPFEVVVSVRMAHGSEP